MPPPKLWKIILVRYVRRSEHVRLKGVSNTDWLSKNELKGKQGVEMPEEVVRKTQEKYKEAFEKLVGRPWSSEA